MRGPRLRFMYHQMMPPTMMIPAMIHTHGTSAVVVGVACASAVVLTSMRYPIIVVTPQGSKRSHRGHVCWPLASPTIRLRGGWLRY